VEEFKYLGTILMNQTPLSKKLMQIEVRERLLLFGTESFVFQFVTQKYKD